MPDAQGSALTIGLNSVNPRRYNGWRGVLSPCENDARDMADIARSQGFTTKILRTRQATRRAVIAAITAAAEALQPGDIFMISFSGHGGQVFDTDREEQQDRNAREGDNRDETWFLYDAQLIDDELYELWLKFKQGVRVIVFSDSCHSGSILAAPPPLLAPRRQRRGTTRRRSVKATVLLISASLDSQDASAGQPGDRNSVFTRKLKEVWNNGTFRGGYRAFWKEIGRRLPQEQTSNWDTVGTRNAGFYRQRPFTI